MSLRDSYIAHVYSSLQSVICGNCARESIAGCARGVPWRETGKGEINVDSLISIEYYRGALERDYVGARETRRRRSSLTRRGCLACSRQAMDRFAI
jgi:hypothetical protein